jgi:hypothetical protein
MASGSALAEAQGTDLDLPCRPAAYVQPNRDFPNEMDKTMGGFDPFGYVSFEPEIVPRAFGPSAENEHLQE